MVSPRNESPTPATTLRDPVGSSKSEEGHANKPCAMPQGLREGKEIMGFGVSPVVFCEWVTGASTGFAGLSWRPQTGGGVAGQVATRVPS